jgi:hypothetical protein
MRKLVAVMLLVLGTSTVLMAGGGLDCPVPVSVPEVDPIAGTSAVALIAGAILVIRGRRNKSVPQ